MHVATSQRRPLLAAAVAPLVFLSLLSITAGGQSPQPAAPAAALLPFRSSPTPPPTKAPPPVSPPAGRSPAARRRSFKCPARRAWPSLSATPSSPATQPSSLARSRRTASTTPCPTPLPSRKSSP